MIMCNVHVSEGKQRVHNSIEMIELYLCDFFLYLAALMTSFVLRDKHFHDSIISLKLVYPSHFFFIKVSVPSQKGEMLCICVLRVLILPLSVIYLQNCPIILFVLIIFNFFFYEISPLYEINRSTFVVTCFRGIIDNYSVPRNQVRYNCFT